MNNSINKAKEVLTSLQNKELTYTEKLTLRDLRETRLTTVVNEQVAEVFDQSGVILTSAELVEFLVTEFSINSILAEKVVNKAENIRVSNR